MSGRQVDKKQNRQASGSWKGVHVGPPDAACTGRAELSFPRGQGPKFQEVKMVPELTPRTIGANLTQGPVAKAQHKTDP